MLSLEAVYIPAYEKAAGEADRRFGEWPFHRQKIRTAAGRKPFLASKIDQEIVLHSEFGD